MYIEHRTVPSTSSHQREQESQRLLPPAVQNGRKKTHAKKKDVGVAGQESPKILDHSYLVRNLTNSKIAETKL